MHSRECCKSRVCTPPSGPSQLTSVRLCHRWSTGGFRKTVKRAPRRRWHPAVRTTPGWRGWRQTPTTLLRFGATTLQDTGRSANTTRSTPRRPVCCALKQFITGKQHESVEHACCIHDPFFCLLTAPTQALKIIGQKIKGRSVVNIAWEKVKPLANEAAVAGYKVSTGRHRLWRWF